MGITWLDLWNSEVTMWFFLGLLCGLIAGCGIFAALLFWLSWGEVVAELDNGQRVDSSLRDLSSTTPPSGILIAICLLVSLSCGGCQSQAGPRTQAALTAADTTVQGADDHVATAVAQTTTAQTEVRTAIPLSTPAATPHLKTADGQLTLALIELPAARADLKSAMASLATAKAEAAALAADRDAWQHKYESQWFAGKFWKAFWVVVIGGSVLLIIMAFLNIKTDLFVVPFEHIGKWISDVFAGTVKAFWNVCVGVWTELASLFKKKPSPTPTTLPTSVAGGAVSTPAPVGGL